MTPPPSPGGKPLQQCSQVHALRGWVAVPVVPDMHSTKHLYWLNSAECVTDGGTPDAALDRDAKLIEIQDRLNRLRSPFRSAESFWIEEIVDPRDTRALLCDFANTAAPLRETGQYRHMMRP